MKNLNHILLNITHYLSVLNNFNPNRTHTNFFSIYLDIHHSNQCQILPNTLILFTCYLFQIYSILQEFNIED